MTDNSSLLERLGVSDGASGLYAGGWHEAAGDALVSSNPATGDAIGSVKLATAGDYEKAVSVATATFQEWKMVPAPKRGDYIRQIGNALRDLQTELGTLVSLESGKILAEGEGEVQEMIDIADFAVGCPASSTA